MQDAFLPLKGFLGSYLARLEKDFSFNWIAQEENLGLLSDLTANDSQASFSSLHQHPTEIPLFPSKFTRCVMMRPPPGAKRVSSVAGLQQQGVRLFSFLA
jgi:hypothetical protein